MLTAGGFCSSCGCFHTLASGEAEEPAGILMDRLNYYRRLDFDLPEEQADPRCSLDPLYGEGRGQMFGVLVCRNPAGQRIILKAFSGQYQGLWEVSGWVPPILNPGSFRDLVDEPDRRIKELGRRIADLSGDEHRRQEVSALRKERKSLSGRLMEQIHDLYGLTNFRGERRPLSSFFSRGIPAGSGDCCAPKLLNHAARLSMTPVALAEFFWGRENLSGTRSHGRFYSPCEEKCGPILGFLLCGSQEQS